MNQRKDLNVDKYVAYGKELLSIPVKKIFFTTKNIIEDYKIESNEHTLVVEIQEQSYLHELKKDITNFSLHTTTPEKDTLDYMICMCDKTEYMRRAVEIDPYKSTNYIWVDFGIKRVFKTDKFSQIVQNASRKEYTSLRMGSIWPPSYQIRGNIYKDIMWYFAGGVFGGEKNALLLFADKMKAKCIEIVKESHSLMWEVNIWRLIYLDDPSIFSLYPCDHNDTILLNY